MHSNYLTSVVGTTSDQMLKKTIFTSDVAVQTDALVMGPVTSVLGSTEDPMKDFNYDEEAFQLTSSDLAAILRWSKDISSDINLSSGKECCFSIHFETFMHAEFFSSTKVDRDRDREFRCSVCMCRNSSRGR